MRIEIEIEMPDSADNASDVAGILNRLAEKIEREGPDQEATGAVLSTRLYDTQGRSVGTLRAS